jgi:hypothetical protein
LSYTTHTVHTRGFRVSGLETRVVSWLLGADAGGSRRTSRARATIARGSSSSSCSVAMNSLSSACSTGHCHVRKKIKKKPARSQCGSPVCLLHWRLSRRDKRETHYRTLWNTFVSQVSMVTRVTPQAATPRAVLRAAAQFLPPKRIHTAMLPNDFFFGLHISTTSAHPTQAAMKYRNHNIHGYVCVCVCVCLCVCVCVFVYTYVYTYMHTYIYIYKRINVYKCHKIPQS